LEFTL